MLEVQSENRKHETQSVLITGGSGFVGSRLTTMLIAEGYKVSHLSVSLKTCENVPVYFWNPRKGEIDNEALNGIDYIVHLAGTNIGEKRWTRKRKEEILKSRIDSASLLFKTVIERKISLKAFISASGIGYYGSNNQDITFSEADRPSTDFLGQTCRLWEEGADLFASHGIRTVKIRTGIVLDKYSGALPRLYKPAYYGLVIRTGSGDQYMPWIHITDLCKVYIKAIKDYTMEGPYNAVSPQHITHNDFVRLMAASIHRPVFLPGIPSWILSLVLGEMAGIILKGNRVSSEKLIKSGFNFSFPDLKGALNDILAKKP